MSWTIAFVAMTFLVCVTVILHHWITKTQAPRPPRAADPEALLAERYARGEIDEAEYAHRLSVIKLGPPLELR